MIVHPETVTVPAGGGVTLTCVSHGSPIPDITWLKGEEQIDNDTSTVAIFESVIQQASLDFFQSILEICSLQLADAGEYSCYTNNSMGNQSVMFQVIVTQGTATTMPGSLNHNVTLAFQFLRLSSTRRVLLMLSLVKV